MTPRAQASGTTRKRPATGDARKTHHPLKIDRLPVLVQAAICDLYRGGFTWMEIEQLSKQPIAERGFVEWDKLDTEVLELFPGRYIPHSNLHRFYDLRIAQVKKSVMERSSQAREVAEAFANSVVEGGSEAVVNAARDTIMTVLAEDNSAGGRSKAARALVGLAEVMQTARANDIKERKVAVDERKMAQMEKDAELRSERMQQETQSAAKKLTKGELTLDDLNKLRRNTFGLPPLTADGKEVTS